jgi:putative transposase
MHEYSNVKDIDKTWAQARKNRRSKKPHKDWVLNGKIILKLTVSVLCSSLVIATQGTYKSQDIFRTVVTSCAMKTSLKQVCRRFKRCASLTTVRHHLKKISLETLENKANTMLAKFATTIIPKHAHKWAIDITHKPYYGDVYQKENEVVSSQPKKGTTRFHAYATIYLILMGKRFTLAIKYIRKGEDPRDTIDYLVEKIYAQGFSIQYLLLDRGFYSAKVINHLMHVRNIPFIMPVVVHGKNGGFRRLFKGKKSYRTSYPLHSVKEGITVTFPAHIVMKYAKGKRGKHRIDYYGYVVHGVHIPVKSTYDKYRIRFGIESSYRICWQSLPKTTSRNPKIRFLFVITSLLIQNHWIYLRWKYLGERRQGHRQIKKDKFTYADLLQLIVDAMTSIYGVITEIETNELLHWDKFKQELEKKKNRRKRGC